MNEPHTDILTDTQRVQRIAALLCKAIVISEARAAVNDSAGESDDDASAMENTANDRSDERRVLGYLELAGQASPLSIRTALGLSRSSAYRILQRLNVDGQIVASGQTRSISYCLNRVQPPLDKIGLN